MPTAPGLPALLLVGHGSRSPASGAEMAVMRDKVAAALPEVAVELGYLEMSEPPAGAVLDQLVAEGAGQVVVMPVVLFGAGHAKNDMPAVVTTARARHPGVGISFGSPLGVSRPLVAALGEAIESTGGRNLPLLVIARGTSDPDANGEAAKAARLLAEWNGSAFHQLAFTGVTGPSVPEALEVMSVLGHDRITAAFWFLCTGRLVERARRQLAEFSTAGRAVLDAGYLGSHPDVISLIVRRYREALEGVPVVNCDTCAYRAAWPGLGDRVGQPIGVGHSHLAAEHLHHHP